MLRELLPVPESIIDPYGKEQSFQNAIYINREEGEPDIEGMDIALLGIQPENGTSQEPHFADVNSIRRYLYAMAKSSGRNRIIDLGNFVLRPTFEETLQTLSELLALLVSKNTLAIIVGGGHELDLAQFEAYGASKKEIHMLSVDSVVDMGDINHPSQSHLLRMTEHPRYHLNSYSHLAFQSYLVESRQLDYMEKRQFETVRLGRMRDDPDEIEPLIRGSNLVSVDVGAIKSYYCPASMNPGVFGLTGEEACKICWYAGVNNAVSSLGIYGFDMKAESPDMRTTQTVSTMIWYFIEGFYHRLPPADFSSKEFTVFDVNIDGDEESIRFFRNNLSSEWWMEVGIPGREGKDQGGTTLMVPCSEKDYKSATKGEVPERWLKAVNRHSHDKDLPSAKQEEEIK